MHINCYCHPTNVMSDLQTNFIFNLSHLRQIWLSTHVEKDALSGKLKYQCDTFYDLFLFITSI